MPFHIPPFREFLVRPAIPDRLARMPELAYNLLWTWEPIIRALFRRLDHALWRECGYNPVLMLGRVPQATLDRMASDHRYVGLYRMACQRFDAHMHSGEPPAEEGKLIAYFCAEYGLAECMPIYSGGLGVLSGDHLKASSDAYFPLIGVGLLYQQGYFRQLLNPDGWQQERFPINDFYTLPVRPMRDANDQDVKVSVKLPTGEVMIQVWKIEVGKIKLFLLDTNLPENQNSHDRDITDALYGGDSDTRMRQEIVLGIGGMRALKAMGLEPTVYHMNEGHSAFLALERIRSLMKERKLTFEEALEAARASCVFTTHTPVPAGIDLFEPGRMYHYFHEYCEETGISFEQLMSLGRNPVSGLDQPFSMAVLALQSSAYRNTVSRLHRHVSQEMWHSLWPKLPVWEVPLTSITNGVHLPGWLNGDLAALYDQYLQPDWREHYADPAIWEQVQDIPDEELLEVRRRRQRRLVNFIRMRQHQAALRRQASAGEVQRAQQVLEYNALTIGFARRFATYKRATLIFRDLERLKKILGNKDMPMQIVIAGKAHPKDQPGKTFIREIVEFSRHPDLWKHVVFVEDYDMKVGRELVQGVDLWLNTPKRGHEACGTSGMKAGINGVLNLSILDGWYDEAYEQSGGWAIGDREPYSEDQDPLHASNIYYLLENEIVPMFYERRDQVSREWLRRVKQCIMYISPQFNCRRMVEEYMNELYNPAHAEHLKLSRTGYDFVRERARWSAKVREAWEKVHFVDGDLAQVGSVVSGGTVPVRAAVDLAGLTPEDVRVEVVLGRVGSDGGLEDTEVTILKPLEQKGNVFIFGNDIAPERTGLLGYALRISPDHFDDPLTRPATTLMKWSDVETKPRVTRLSLY